MPKHIVKNPRAGDVWLVRNAAEGDEEGNVQVTILNSKSYHISKSVYNCEVLLGDGTITRFYVDVLVDELLISHLQCQNT